MQVRLTHQHRWRLLLGMLAAGTALQAGFARPSFAQEFQTTTPIRHVVVIFQENHSFDNYFGTYPTALNLAGEPPFTPFAATPTVNGLSGNQPTSSVLDPGNVGGLFTSNQNAVAPFRLDRVNAVTCDQDHGYTDEQQAVDAGLLDHFALASGSGGTSATGVGCQTASGANIPGFAMGYYDGNTVTALWNYAQHYAMSDNSFGTQFGPSTPGAINLITGQTHGAVPGPSNTSNLSPGALLPDGSGHFTLINDVDSGLDDCGSPTANVAFTDPAFSQTNVGDLLNAQGITWGWFGGGFTPTVAATGMARAVCGATTTLHLAAPLPPGATSAQVNTPKADYNAHHSPFQYYSSTVNPHHLPPTSTAAIGFTDQANHQYDLSMFFTALAAGNLPAVSYLKAINADDGHPGAESDPLSEQVFIVNTINAIQQSPFWEDTAIIIAYDDSDGWYDHVTGPIVNASSSSADAFTAAGGCGTPAKGAFPGRCGYGPRLPLLVISPWSKQNYVDHNVTDQTSILLFIEQNWNLGFIDGPTAPPKGQASFDRIAGQLNGLFDFDERPHPETVILNPSTGLLVP
jgi:phospholipase C